MGWWTNVQCELFIFDSRICVDQGALRAVCVKTEKHASSVQATQIYPYALFVCTLQVRFLLSPFPIVLVAVSITVFARFDRNS